MGAHLDEPHDVVGVQAVLADPGGQDVPLHALAPIDADAQLRVLVLARLQGFVQPREPWGARAAAAGWLLMPSDTCNMRQGGAAQQSMHRAVLCV